MSKRRIYEQQKAKDHLQDLLNVENGLSNGHIKWIEIYHKKMASGDTFSQRDMEVIYDIYEQALNKGLV